MERSVSEGALDGDSRSDELAYRSVSPLAVLGFALAVVSPVAFVSGLLWVVPLISAFFCLLAVRAIRRDPETTAGLGLATAGFALAIAVATAAYVRAAAVERLHNEAAGRVADRFVELLAEGDAISALELTQPHSRRRPTRDAAAIYYESDEEAAERLEEFNEHPAIRRAVAAAGSAPRLLETAPPFRKRGGVVVATRWYALPEPPALRLVLERSSPRAKGAVSWRVTKYDSADPVK